MADNEQVVDQTALVTGDDDEQEEPEVPQGGDLKVALKQERQKRQSAQRALKQLQEDMGKIKPLADEYAQLLPYLPDLIAKADKAGKQPQTTGGVVEDPEALEFAQLMGYEKTDGTPDVEKARKALDFHDRRTGAKVTKEVSGVKNQTSSVVARQVMERAYKAVGDDGKLYAKKEFIDKVFSELSPEAIANPDTAVAALIMARGLGGPGEDADLDEPIYTERAGAPKRRTVSVSDMGKSIAKIRGKNEVDWAKLQDEPAETGWDLE